VLRQQLELDASSSSFVVVGSNDANVFSECWNETAEAETEGGGSADGGRWRGGAGGVHPRRERRSIRSSCIFFDTGTTWTADVIVVVVWSRQHSCHFCGIQRCR